MLEAQIPDFDPLRRNLAAKPWAGWLPTAENLVPHPGIPALRIASL
jgi:hypothetical protein